MIHPLYLDHMEVLDPKCTNGDYYSRLIWHSGATKQQLKVYEEILDHLFISIKQVNGPKSVQKLQFLTILML